MVVSEKEFLVCSEVQDDWKSSSYKTRDSNTERLATKQEDACDRNVNHFITLLIKQSPGIKY